MLTRPARRAAFILAGALGCGLLSACADDEVPLASSSTASEAAESAAEPSADATPQEAEFPVTVESCGREFTYGQAPERALIGHPQQITTLDALGVADRVIGYFGASTSAGEPPEEFADLPEVSPDYQPSREVALEARPDLVIPAAEDQLAGEAGVSYEDLEGLDAGVYVLGGACESGLSGEIEGLFDDIRALGRIFGVEDRAEEVVADLAERVEKAAALRGTQAPARVAFVQVFDGKLFALAGSTYQVILSGAGLANEFSDIEESFVEISAEEALTRRPDVLLVADDFDDPEGAIADVRALLGSTPAVENDRVYALNGQLLLGSGVTVVELIEEAAEAVYGS